MAPDASNPSAGNSKLFPGLNTPASSAPSTDPSKNVFTELFGKDNSVPTASLMNTVIGQKEKQTVSFLGKKAPTEALSLKSLTQTHQSHPGTAFLSASFLILLLVVFGFLTQTSSRFSVLGTNPAARVQWLTEQSLALKSEVRVQHALSATLLLNQFSSLADEYLYAQSQVDSTYTSQNKKADFAKQVTALKPQITDLLGTLQTHFSESIPTEEIPNAVAVADDLIAQLNAKSGQVDDSQLRQELQDLATSKNLLQNHDFQNFILSLDLTAVTDEQLTQVLTDFSSLNASLTAVIHSIESSRNEWSTALEELERLTKKVDPLFGTEFSGNLTLTSVIFDSNGTVTVSGDTSTNDTRNFTLVSNLVDEYENSDLFTQVEERTYQKSAQDKNYVGSFRITMQLESYPSSNE